MKCTSKKIISFLLILCMALAATGCGKKIFDENVTAESVAKAVVELPIETNTNLGTINFCNENVNTKYAHAAALYNITEDKILYSKNINDKLYPASTTKILTAYCALKHGNLKDRIKVSENCVHLERGASVCGLQAGDTITLEDALYGLMTCSGNDAGIAIAEHICGSVEGFAEVMNKEAQAIGATNSHFLNPHGLHEKEHYTTLNDLYLIFKEAIKLDKFRDLISQKEYTGTVTSASGDSRNITWHTTNRYFSGAAAEPKSVTVLGSKTGTTNEAGSCLVLLSKDKNNKEYISIILKTSDPGTIYLEMTDMFDTLIGSKEK